MSEQKIRKGLRPKAGNEQSQPVQQQESTGNRDNNMNEHKDTPATPWLKD